MTEQQQARPATLAPPHETGRLGICHLKRLWSVANAQRQGLRVERDAECELDHLLLNALGLGVHQTMEFLFQRAPTFEAVEDWVEATVGVPDPELLARLNADVLGTRLPANAHRALAAVEAAAPVFSDDELAFWVEHGFVLLHDAVDAERLTAAERAVWEFVGADPVRPETWYHTRAHGVMAELIQHPALHAIRHAPRIHKAFAQLYASADLWPTADRCGFHPPQTPTWPFPGPDLHWDVDFARPIEYRTQGILYLTDTPSEQGAFTLVPGFHHRLESWLANLPAGADPQDQDLHALGSRPIAGRAGDLVIWHHGLPHGASPNRGSQPRIVQYLTMMPGWHGGRWIEGPD